MEEGKGDRKRERMVMIGRRLRTKEEIEGRWGGSAGRVREKEGERSWRGVLACRS